MSTAAIRQKLHSYLEVANDKKIKAIYAIMEKEIEESAVDYTEELKNDLDQRYADYKNGKVKVLSATQSKKQIEAILYPATTKRKK
jgi:hypothetical protein